MSEEAVRHERRKGGGKNYGATGSREFEEIRGAAGGRPFGARCAEGVKKFYAVTWRRYNTGGSPPERGEEEVKNFSFS